MRVLRLGMAATLAMLVGACGGGNKTCDPLAQSGCKGSEVCEEVEGGEPACFAPVVLRGQVFDLESGAAIEGARVVALDENRAPVSSVAVTDIDGNYELAVPLLRDEAGVPIEALDVTLRADAAGYQSFPGGLRRALPIDTGSSVEEMNGTRVVESSLTDVGLLALEAAPGGSVFGQVEVPADQTGVLVVAESGGEGFYAIADRDGGYRIFNVPDGDYAVSGYARGVNYVPAEVTVAGDEVEADLDLSDEEASTLSGRVEIVDGGGADATSIILVVASTFDDVLVRGATPPGLRAPEPGLAPDVSGDFSLDGVPAGEYVILAAFENDDLVRDPDSCIAGTELVYQSVGAAEDVAIDQSFKVTGALDVIGPGPDGAEMIAESPTLSWGDDSSEEEYRLQVINSFGDIVWETSEPGASGTDPAVAYGGDALEAGMYYQFRVTSVRSTGGQDECEISQTEDLEGIFFMP